jgi:hypothetical protein
MTFTLSSKGSDEEEGERERKRDREMCNNVLYSTQDKACIPTHTHT